MALNEGSTLANSPFANYCDADGNLAVHPMGEKNTYNMGYNYDFNHQYEQLEKGYYVLNSIFTAKLKLPFYINYSFNARSPSLRLWKLTLPLTSSQSVMLVVNFILARMAWYSVPRMTPSLRR